MDQFYTIREAATILKVDHKTIRRAIAAPEYKRLEAGKIGRVYRIEESAINDYFQRSKKGFPNTKK